MPVRLQELPRACECLAVKLKEKFPQCTALFKGRAGTSLWVRTVDTLYRGTHLFRDAMRKEACDSLEEEYAPEISFIQATIIGAAGVQQQEELLREVFVKRIPSDDPEFEKSLYRFALLHDKNSQRDLYSLSGDGMRFYYLIDFEELVAFPAHRLRTSVRNLTLAVEDPAYIVANTIKELVEKYCSPYSSVICWSTLIILQKIFTFANNSLPPAVIVRSPFEEDQIRDAMVFVKSFNELIKLPYWVSMIKRNTATLKKQGKDRPSWQRDLVTAVEFICRERSTPKIRLDLAQSSDPARLPLWPTTLENFVPIEREEAPRDRRPHLDRVGPRENQGSHSPQFRLFERFAVPD